MSDWRFGEYASSDNYEELPPPTARITVRPRAPFIDLGPSTPTAEDLAMAQYIEALRPAPKPKPPEPIEPTQYDIPRYVTEASEAAAQRLSRPYERANRESQSNIPAVADFLKPETPLDYAMMVGVPGYGLLGQAATKLPRYLRSAALAAGALTTADEAEAGISKAAKKTTGALRAAVNEALTPKPERNVGFAPGSVLGAPSIGTRKLPTADDIAAIRAAAYGFGHDPWPVATRDVFKTTPEAYAETTKLVPQVSIRSQLPGPLPGEKLPLKERAAPIVADTNRIADQIAERLDPMVRGGSELTKFYHTGPVIRGLEQYGGLSIPEANQFMRTWSGQGAATSPKTKTPPNMRNASHLLYEMARGTPMTRARFDAEGNVPGYGMMGSHVDKAEQFARNEVNPWKNPKPFTFRENWSGNLSDVTTDTHNIRATLFEFDRMKPGQLPREWFSSDEAYRKYQKEGFLSLGPGAIKDTLGSTTVDKVSRQSEYLPMTEPWYRAAQKLGIAPAEGQSAGWFSYGPITGLASPPRTIPNLLNDQVVATAKALNVPPEKVVEWWAQGRIPLAGMGGAALLAPGALGSLAAQDNY